MPDPTAIANMALSHLACSKEIQNIETDRTAEAAACRRFYAPTLKEVFRNTAWPFATVMADLALVEEDPNDEWAFSYRYPSDCKFFRRILSGIRLETKDSRIPYKIGKDSQGLLIFTDMENAQCEYTVYEQDTERYPDDFTMAFSLLLAGYIAPRVCGADPFKLGNRAFQLYAGSRGNAAGNAFNEQQEEQPPVSEFISGRS